MVLETMESTRPQDMDREDRLFRHTVKPEWGVGLWVAEERTRRRLQFEDGVLRAFKKGYYDLLSPVDPDRVDVDEMFERIATDHQQLVEERIVAEARKAKPPVMSFADQVRVFDALYPGGFGGEAYQLAVRHPESGSKPRKSHVDPDVRRAQKRLAKKRMKHAVQSEDYDAIHDDLMAVLRRTSLVTPAKGYKLFADLDADRKRTVGKALFKLLWGKKRFRRRFEKWLAALSSCGIEVSWPLATVFPALVFPDEHVVVKRRPFDVQARSVAPSVAIPKQPGKRAYRRARRVARVTRRQLGEAGLEPADFLDVRQFIWDTLRPKGQQVLEQLDA